MSYSATSTHFLLIRAPVPNWRQNSQGSIWTRTNFVSGSYAPPRKSAPSRPLPVRGGEVPGCLLVLSWESSFSSRPPLDATHLLGRVPTRTEPNLRLTKEIECPGQQSLRSGSRSRPPQAPSNPS